MQLEVIGLFTTVYFLPFVKTGGGDKTTALFECVPEEWFFSQGFRAGINRLVFILLFRPVRNQAPMAQSQLVIAVIQPDNRDVAGWGNVVAGMEIDGVAGGKMLS